MTKGTERNLAGFLGDKQRRIVHHLQMIKPECRIYHIEKKDRVYFTPDLLDNAENSGFILCKYCIKNPIKPKQEN